jgi:hypothetical protein
VTKVQLLAGEGIAICDRGGLRNRTTESDGEYQYKIKSLVEALFESGKRNAFVPGVGHTVQKSFELGVCPGMSVTFSTRRLKNRGMARFLPMERWLQLVYLSFGPRGLGQLLPPRRGERGGELQVRTRDEACRSHGVPFLPQPGAASAGLRSF